MFWLRVCTGVLFCLQLALFLWGVWQVRSPRRFTVICGWINIVLNAVAAPFNLWLLCHWPFPRP